MSFGKIQYAKYFGKYAGTVSSHNTCGCCIHCSCYCMCRELSCHFVDLLCFLTNQSPVEVHAHALTNPGRYSNDNVICSLRFADGSQGTISYLANGNKSYSKERLEVFGGGRVAMLEDFRRLELIKQGRKQVLQSRFRQDKGHRSEWSAFVDAIRSGKESPIPFGQILTSMLATFRLDESRSLGRSLSVGSLPCQASTF